MQPLRQNPGSWPRIVGVKDPKAKQRQLPSAAPKGKGKGGRDKVKGRGKDKLREVEEGEEGPEGHGESPQ